LCGGGEQDFGFCVLIRKSGKGGVTQNPANLFGEYSEI